MANKDMKFKRPKKTIDKDVEPVLDKNIPLFDNIPTSGNINAAIELLTKAGYVIIKRDKPDKITNIKDVVNYFYFKLYAKHPEAIKFSNHTLVRDLDIASEFVSSIEQDSGDRLNAIRECVDIIDIIFEKEEEFNLKKDIVDMSILTQGIAKWITYKALQLLTDKRIEMNEMKDEAKQKEVEDSIEINLEDISLTLDKMLSLEVNNG